MLSKIIEFQKNRIMKMIMKMKTLIFLAVLLSFSFSLSAQDQGEKYVLETLDFNSEASDYSAINLEGATIFCSDRTADTVTKMVKRYDYNTKRDFTDFYAVNTTEKTKKLLKVLNSDVHDGPMSITKDGNRVYFSRNGSKELADKRKRYLQIFYVDYKNGEWSEEVALPINSSSYNVSHPAISPDGTVLYFSSDMPDGKGGNDIYRIVYNKEDKRWGIHQNLGDAVNSKADEVFPFFTEDNKLYFSSNDKGGKGGLDIYMAELKKDNESFTKKEQLAEPINSKSDDFAFYEMKADIGRKGFLSSNRTGSKGLDDIYSWRFIENPLTVKGIVKNTNNDLIKDTDVVFVAKSASSEDEQMSEMIATTDEKGYYEIVLERETEYEVTVKNDFYYQKTHDLSTKVDVSKKFIEYDIVLEDLPFVRIIPIDADDGTNIENMAVKINLDNEFSTTDMTGKNGVKYEFPKSYRIGDEAEFIVSFVKNGYVEKEVAFTLLLENTGEIIIPVDIREQFICVKFKEDFDVTKLIGVKAIYYDYGSAEIRSDAAVELDKVCRFLNKYPAVSLELRSHTDNRGSNQHNYNLSDQRAKSAADYIKARIDNPNQISGRGYGENQPRKITAELAEEYRFLSEGDILDERFINGLATKDMQEEAHQLNRRTELIVTGVDETKYTTEEEYKAPLILYKVQVLSSKYKIETSDPVFKGYTNVSMYEESGRYKYTIGSEAEFSKADALRKQLANDFKGCFVVAFKNGKRITLSEARNY